MPGAPQIEGIRLSDRRVLLVAFPQPWVPEWNWGRSDDTSYLLEHVAPVIEEARRELGLS